MACLPGCATGRGKGRNAQESRRDRDWSGLPAPALFSVAMSLTGSPADVLDFGRVCRYWRSVAEDSERVLVASLPPLLFRGPTADFYCLADGGSYKNRRLAALLIKREVGSGGIYGCSFGHFVFRHFEDDAKTGTFFVVNPLTGALVRHFPTDTRDLPAWTALTSHPASPDCRLCTYDGHQMVKFRPPGDKDWTITTFSVKLQRYTSAPAFVQNKAFFCSSSTRALEQRSCACDAEILDVRLERDESCRGIKGFRVYRFDFTARTFVRLRSVGRRALFWDAFGATVSQDPGRWGGSGNCIYFVDRDDGRVGVYHLEDGRMEYCAAGRGSPSPSPSGTESRSGWTHAWVHPSLCYGVHQSDHAGNGPK